MSILVAGHSGASLPKREKKRAAPSWAGLLLRLGDRYLWLTLFLVFLVLEIPVLSVEMAHWIDPQPALSLILVLGVLGSWLAVVLKVHVLLAHLLALGIGAPVVWWQVHGLGGSPTFWFAVFIASVTWLTGYLGSWFALARKSPWVGVGLGAAVLLVNLSNLPGSYFFYFGFYFIAVVFLLVWLRFLRASPGAGAQLYGGRGLVFFVVLLGGLAAVAVTFAWVVPEVRFPALQSVISSKILWQKDLESSSWNIFAAVPSKQARNTSSMRLNLPFEAGWHDGERVDFFVESPKPSYWQVHAYEVYTARGWENGAVNAHSLRGKSGWRGADRAAGAEPFTYEVTPNVRTDALLITGTFLSAGGPVIVQESGGEVISVLASHILSPGERYRVTAISPAVSAEGLASAGEDYPPEILERYLQLPPDLPESVRELSASITRGAGTPYEKVAMINAYLARFSYASDIGQPPEGTDGVAYFLFQRKAGFCVHFASAMAVMLRTVGVPSRLAVGYLPGEAGAEKGVYVLRDKHYHAWAQVYFPGFGWVDVEATPSSAETAGQSGVPGAEPVVTAGSLGELPGRDTWFLPGYYGLPPGQDIWEASSQTAEPPVRAVYRGPWVFADELGKALLITLLTVVFLVLAGLPFHLLRSSFYRWVWHVDRQHLGTLAFEKLCQLGAVVGMAPKPHETPLEYAAVLTKEFPEQAPAIQEITRAYLERKFGTRREPPDLFDEARILKARCAVYGAMLLRLGFLEKLFGGRW